MSTPTLEQYRRDNGFYDEAKIMMDAGESERHARFADIFGDAQGTPDLGAYNAILAEARRLNAERHATIEAAAESEARDILAKPELSRDDWRRLVELRFAAADTFDGGEQGVASTRYQLTTSGERLLDPNYPLDYAEEDLF